MASGELYQLGSPALASLAPIIPQMSWVAQQQSNKQRQEWCWDSGHCCALSTPAALPHS